MGATLWAGCGDDDGSFREEYPERAAEAQCTYLYDCCTEEEREESDLFGLNGESKEECVSEWEPLIEMAMMETEDAENDGRVAFDEAKAEACLEEFENAGCDGPAAMEGDEQPEVCDEVVTPQVEVGGDCLGDDECIDGYCDDIEYDEETGERTSMGTCYARGDDGDDCTFADECKEGLECQFGECVEMDEIGDDCEPSSCVSDAYCAIEDEVCKEKKGEGESCTGSVECSSGECDTDSTEGSEGSCAAGESEVMCTGN